MQVRVTATRWEAHRVTSFELAPVDGQNLPPWSPGAHIDVRLPSGTVRQYSLCGDLANRQAYRIAVLELPQGRGGSLEVHRELRAGTVLTIGAPRSNFALVDADRYVFVAGGIGITPLLPMIQHVAERGIKWELFYGARSREHFAFLGRLGNDSVHLVAQDTDGLIDLEQVVAESVGAALYCCGPRPLMDALSARMLREHRTADLHIEHFGATAVPSGDVAQDGFDLELARSGVVVTVPAGQSVLEAVRGAGVDHPSSCEMGFCGTCEARVLSGAVDHRDELLTEEEKARGTTMLICVSRAAGERLALDI
ncbi:oxidoreductase [Mycobacterium sp. MS1601]|nr:oxidoreductase [Mycobacterium sp. MS1601]